MLVSRSHLWVNLSRRAKTAVIARIGLTERGLQDIGSVSDYRYLKERSDSTAPPLPLLELDWDAYKISNADELYHCSWEAVDGTAIIHSPIPGTVVQFNDANIERACRTNVPLSTSDWLVEIAVEEDVAASLLNASCGSTTDLLDPSAYKRYCEALPRGMFCDEESGYGLVEGLVK